jgi:hypothetical protein
MEGDGCFAFWCMGWYMKYVLGNFLLLEIPSHHFTPLFFSSPFGYKLLKRKPGPSCFGQTNHVLACVVPKW